MKTESEERHCENVTNQYGGGKEKHMGKQAFFLITELKFSNPRKC